MSVTKVHPDTLEAMLAVATELGSKAHIELGHPTRDYLVVDNEIEAWSDKPATA